MADFGDDVVEIFRQNAKQAQSMILRELFYRWMRESQQGEHAKETVGNQTYDVKMFDDEAQRQIFEEKLRAEGIQFTEKTVPAVSYNHADAKKVEKIYKQVLNEIDTGNYTPTKAEQEYSNNTPASTQVKYDLTKAVNEGKLDAADLQKLGKDYTLGDVMNMLEGKYPDLQEELVQTWQARADKNREGQDEQPSRNQAKDASSQEKTEVPAEKDNKQPEKDESLGNEDAPEIKEESLDNIEPNEEALDGANLKQPAEEVAKEIDAPEITDDKKLSPELQSTLEKGVISKDELASLDPTAKLDNQVLADLHPDIAGKMSQAGIDMPEGSWKEQIDKTVSKCFEKGDTLTKFAEKLHSYGIGIRTADTPDPETGKPMIQYFVEGQENRSLNSCNTTSKLTFDDFKKAPTKTLENIHKVKNADVKALAELAKTASVPGRVAAALEAADHNFPEQFNPQSR